MVMNADKTAHDTELTSILHNKNNTKITNRCRDDAEVQLIGRSNGLDAATTLQCVSDSVFQRLQAVSSDHRRVRRGAVPAPQSIETEHQLLLPVQPTSRTTQHKLMMREVEEIQRGTSGEVKLCDGGLGGSDKRLWRLHCCLSQIQE